MAPLIRSRGLFAFNTFAVRLQQSPTVRGRMALQRLSVVRRISVSPTSCMTDPHRGPRSIVFKPPQMRGLFTPSLSTPHIYAHASSPTAQLPSPLHLSTGRDSGRSGSARDTGLLSINMMITPSISMRAEMEMKVRRFFCRSHVAALPLLS